MRVTVIGTGYVGTVTGACLSYLGHRVTCMDTDAQKIEKLRRGEMPIYEPFLEELLQLAEGRGGIDFTTELAARSCLQISTPLMPGRRRSTRIRSGLSITDFS